MEGVADWSESEYSDDEGSSAYTSEYTESRFEDDGAGSRYSRYTEEAPQEQQQAPQEPEGLLGRASDAEQHARVASQL